MLQVPLGPGFPYQGTRVWMVTIAADSGHVPLFDVGGEDAPLSRREGHAAARCREHAGRRHVEPAVCRRRPSGHRAVAGRGAARHRARGRSGGDAAEPVRPPGRRPTWRRGSPTSAGRTTIGPSTRSSRCATRATPSGIRGTCAGCCTRCASTTISGTRSAGPLTWKGRLKETHAPAAGLDGRSLPAHEERLEAVRDLRDRAAAAARRLAASPPRCCTRRRRSARTASTTTSRTCSRSRASRR